MINLEIYKSRSQGGYQVCLEEPDSGWGYRVAGPKMDGQSEILATFNLSDTEAKRLIEELQCMLDN